MLFRSGGLRSRLYAPLLSPQLVDSDFSFIDLIVRTEAINYRAVECMVAGVTSSCLHAVQFVRCFLDVVRRSV